MTRLEKDAIKRLIILGAVIVAVAIMYYFLRDIKSSMGVFGLMGLVGFVDGSRKSKCKEPKLEINDFKKRKNSILITILLSLVFFGYMIWQSALSFDSEKIIFWIVFSVIYTTVFSIITLQKYKKVYVKKTVVLPKYDEREDKVLKKTYTLAFGIFFGIFLLFNLVAGTKTFNKQIPGYILPLQALISAWLFLFILNIAIFWQERRIGKEND